jgi:hypothetical protein
MKIVVMILIFLFCFIGLIKYAPFDKIIVTAACPDITRILFNQLPPLCNPTTKIIFEIGFVYPRM